MKPLLFNHVPRELWKLIIAYAEPDYLDELRIWLAAKQERSVTDGHFTVSLFLRANDRIAVSAVCFWREGVRFQACGSHGLLCSIRDLCRALGTLPRCLDLGHRSNNNRMLKHLGAQLGQCAVKTFSWLNA